MKDMTGECDQPTGGRYRSTDDDGNDIMICRCLVCSRCNRHTGNTNQGHFWSWCSATKRDEGFHFCCPGNCELYP